MHRFKSNIYLLLIAICLYSWSAVSGQDETVIRGFVAIENNYDTRNDNLNFGFGEQDLFITSELSDRFSFLGESLFKYSANTFKIGIERVVIKYNYKGNHNILFGRHHTPLNYWNDSYHHGRLFFPTTGRPAIFTYKIIPIHTNGVSLQGHNLTDLKLGYDIMVGNGIGSTSEMVDNDKTKSIAIGLHLKPKDGMRIGGSIYFDKIAAGAKTPGGTAARAINHQVVSGHIAYFKSSYEFLSEISVATNSDDSLGAKQTMASYIFVGYRINSQLVPYIRYDYVNFTKDEMFYKNADLFMFMTALGIRYEISHLAVVKLEFLYTEKEAAGPSNVINFQIAVGF